MKCIVPARLRALVGMLGLLLLLVACEQQDDGPPPGWETAETRWWQSDIDTTRAFRNLESLSAMGVPVPEVVYGAGAEEGNPLLVREVKQQLIALYRTQPRVVDSLFEEHVLPSLEAMEVSGSLSQTADQEKDEAYRELRTRYYREPEPRLTLGEDVMVNYPDSLRQAGVGGKVRMQIHLNEEGEPLAVKLLDPIHPQLDREALRIASQMRWRPARYQQDGEWQPVPGWTRYNLTFAPAQ